MTFWAIVLQWSRLGVSALVFLLAARLLPLADIGSFATAFAIPKVLQVVHKSGVVELRITAPAQDRPLFILSVLLGVIAALICLAIAPVLPAESQTHLAALAIIPIFNGLAAVSEGRLRRALKLRALALRTVAAQVFAGALTLIGLASGWGAWSLTTFALAVSILTASMSLMLSPPDLRRSAPLRPLLPDLARLTLRPLAGAGVFAATQVLIGLMIGLPAAGAFQIATRFVELIDALALSPLRYLALPRFKALVDTPEFIPRFRQSLWQVAILAILIYPTAWASAPVLLSILGPDKALSAGSLLTPLLVFGALSALLMPLTQSLVALGNTALPLRRTVWTLVLTQVLLTPVLHHPLALWVLPLSSILASLPFLREARSQLSRLAPA